MGVGAKLRWLYTLHDYNGPYEKINVPEGFFYYRHLYMWESQNFNPLSCCYKPVASVRFSSNGEHCDIATFFRIATFFLRKQWLVWAETLREYLSTLGF